MTKLSNCSIVNFNSNWIKGGQEGLPKKKKKQFYAPIEKTQESTHIIYVSMYLFEELNLCSFKDVHIVSTNVKFCHGCT